MITLLAADDEATQAIGAALAPHLGAGDVVTLAGDLGTGKTALARAIIRARLGAPDEDVPSPTFAIVQPYPGIIHADLYRLADAGEIHELGLFDDESAILLVEWPQRAPILFDLPGLAIRLAMIPGSQGRTISIRARGDRDMGAMATALAPWREERSD